MRHLGRERPPLPPSCRGSALEKRGSLTTQMHVAVIRQKRASSVTSPECAAGVLRDTYVDFIGRTIGQRQEEVARRRRPHAPNKVGCGGSQPTLSAALATRGVRRFRPSTIFIFPRKYFTLFHFTDRASWLVLALRAHFSRVTGTIVGTVDPTGIRLAVPELTAT